jgi:hypothetical protein
MRKYALCLVAFLAVAVSAQEPSRPAAKPLPLDPMTPQEAENAQRIAQSDSKTRELLGSNARIVYVLSIAPKLTPNDNEPHGRHADLLYIRGDNEFGVRVLVDLVAARVVNQERIASSSVPLGRSDVAEALRIATENSEIRSLLGERANGFRVLTGPIGPEAANSDFVEGLRHVGAGPDDPCTTHRCVYLLFNSGGRLILQEQEIVVDLNARQVRVSSARKGGRQ